jgi:hypothetical protein
VHGVIPCSRGRRGLAGVGVGVDRAVLKLPCTKFHAHFRFENFRIPPTDGKKPGPASGPHAAVASYMAPRKSLPLPSLPGVCLATILDASRLPSLLLLRGAWHGELSAAVMARAGEALEAQRAWLASAIALELSFLARLPGEKRYRVVDGRVIESSGAETRALLLENTGFDCPHRFPYNILRNMAFFACRSQFVLSLDVNIVPLPSSPEGYRELQRLVASSGARSATQRAWILPVFEITPLGEERVWQGATTLHRKAAFRSTPETAKHELKKMIRDQIAAPFYSGSRDRSAVAKKPPPPKRSPRRESSDAEPDLLQPTNLSFHKAYKCTDHVRWLQLPRHADRSSYYTVRHCTGHFEPFVIVHKGIFLQPTADGAGRRKYARQPFDTSFVRGFDKVSFTYELFARKATFLVAPSHFLMHLPTPAEENTMAPAAVASRAVRRGGVGSDSSSTTPTRSSSSSSSATSSSSFSAPSTSSLLFEQPLPSSPHRFRRHGSAGASSRGNSNNSRTTCTIEPVREWIRPFADMPGWTCIDSFFRRMAEEHKYVPNGADHGALRRWASRWRGRCHTRADHMEELFRDVAREAGPGAASSDGLLASQHTSEKHQPRAPPADIGMPPRTPRVVEAVGNFDHVTTSHLAAFSLNVKRAGYLRGGNCYGPQNLNFSCWAAYLARTCKSDDVEPLLGSLGTKPCVSSSGARSH